MKCAEFKENVAAFALDALTEDERRACEDHLAEPGPHEGCEQELRRAYEASSLIGASLPSQSPGEHVWDAIERAIEAPERGDAPGTERPPSRTKSSRGDRPGGVTRIEEAHRFRWREGSAWGLAIAAGIAAVALLTAWQNDQARLQDLTRRLAVTDAALVEAEARVASTQNDFEVRIRSADGQWQACLDDLRSTRISLDERDRALRLMGAPETLLIQLTAQGDVPYRASALMNGPAGEAILLSSALAPQEGKDYQLWLIRGDEKISAGLLKANAPAGATLARIDPALLTAGAPDAISVTIEPTGGMPQPTGPIVLLGKVGA